MADAGECQIAIVFSSPIYSHQSKKRGKKNFISKKDVLKSVLL
jgi:hypothetical protein